MGLGIVQQKRQQPRTQFPMEANIMRPLLRSLRKKQQEQKMEKRKKNSTRKTLKGIQILKIKMQKQRQKQSSSTKSKPTAKKTGKRITIIDDSMPNGIFDERMQKHHNIKVKPHSGVTRCIVDHLKPVIRKKPDSIITYTGTIDLTCKDQIATEKIQQMIVDIKRDSLETVIVLSTAVMRRDKQAVDKKVSISELNRKIKEIGEAQKISVIDNSNQDVSCLSRKRVHLNEKGNSYLANDFMNCLKGL